MKLSSDNERYDELQILLIEEIVASIRDSLRDAGVANPRVLGDATAGVAYAIAALFDGGRELTVDGREVVPVLTFASERDGDELIAPESGGSWMHEYVPALLQAGPDDADDDDGLDESIDFGDEDDAR